MHIQLASGRAKAAAAYPTSLSDAFLDGARMEKKAREERISGQLYVVSDMCEKEEEEVAQEESLQCAYDDVLGNQIDPELVKPARAEEMKGFEEFGAYERVTREDIVASMQVDPSTGLSQGDLRPNEIAEWSQLLHEASRVMKPGGRIYVLFSTIGQNASADNVERFRAVLGGLATSWFPVSWVPVHQK